MKPYFTSFVFISGSLYSQGWASGLGPVYVAVEAVPPCRGHLPHLDQEASVLLVEILVVRNRNCQSAHREWEVLREVPHWGIQALPSDLAPVPYSC